MEGCVNKNASACNKPIIKQALHSIFTFIFLFLFQSTRDSSLSPSIILLLLHPFQSVFVLFFGQSYHLHPKLLKKKRKKKSERRETSCLMARVNAGSRRGFSLLISFSRMYFLSGKKREPCDNVGRYQISSAQSACHSAAQMGRALIDGWALARNTKKKRKTRINSFALLGLHRETFLCDKSGITDALALHRPCASWPCQYFTHNNLKRR